LGVSLDEFAASLPPGSTKVVFLVTGVSVPLPANFQQSFEHDVALNIAFMLELGPDDADAIVQMLDLGEASGCADTASGRRLLSLDSVVLSSMNLTMFIHGDISTALPALNITGSLDASMLTEMLVERVSNGLFIAPSTQLNMSEVATVPLIDASSSSTGSVSSFITSSAFSSTALIDSPDSTEDGEQSSDTSTSSGLSTGAIVGVVFGCAVGAVMIVGIAVYLVLALKASQGPKDGGVVPAVSDIETATKQGSTQSTAIPVNWIGV